MPSSISDAKVRISEKEDPDLFQLCNQYGTKYMNAVLKGAIVSFAKKVPYQRPNLPPKQEFHEKDIFLRACFSGKSALDKTLSEYFHSYQSTAELCKILLRIFSSYEAASQYCDISAWDSFFANLFRQQTAEINEENSEKENSAKTSGNNEEESLAKNEIAENQKKDKTTEKTENLKKDSSIKTEQDPNLEKAENQKKTQPLEKEPSIPETGRQEDLTDTVKSDSEQPKEPGIKASTPIKPSVKEQSKSAPDNSDSNFVGKKNSNGNRQKLPEISRTDSEKKTENAAKQNESISEKAAQSVPTSEEPQKPKFEFDPIESILPINSSSLVSERKEEEKSDREKGMELYRLFHPNG